jgi:hypothetical protein
MPRVMVSLRLDPEQASLPEVRRLLGLAADEVDPAFGVVNTPPPYHHTTFGVAAAAPDRIAGAPAVEGVFGNPRIEPYGPPEDDPG